MLLVQSASIGGLLVFILSAFALAVAWRMSDEMMQACTPVFFGGMGGLVIGSLCSICAQAQGAAGIRFRLFNYTLVVVCAWILVAPLAITVNPLPGGMVAIIFALELRHVVASIRRQRSWGADRSTVRRHYGRRADVGYELRALTWALPLVFVLLVTYDNSSRNLPGWTWSDIGLDLPGWWPAYVLAGAGLLVPFQWARARGRTGDVAERAEPAKKRFFVLRSRLPRGRRAQAMRAFSTIVTSPMWEEISHRGFLVFYLSTLVGPFAAVFAGYALFLLLHLHLDMRWLWIHTLFYAIVVALTFSPLGLAGAIGFHMAVNAHFVMNLPRQVNEYREWLSQRQWRSSETATNAAGV